MLRDLTKAMVVREAAAIKVTSVAPESDGRLPADWEWTSVALKSDGRLAAYGRRKSRGRLRLKMDGGINIICCL